MWRRFDIVQLITTKNIKFLSGPKGYPANPKGNWSVVGNFSGKPDLVIAKEETIAVVPITDVRKIGTYDPDKALGMIKQIKSMEDIASMYKGDGDGEEET